MLYFTKLFVLLIVNIHLSGLLNIIVSFFEMAPVEVKIRTNIKEKLFMGS